MSTIHQIPRPPPVNNFPTPVPVRPKQNLSKPRKPRNKHSLELISWLYKALNFT